MWVEYTCKGYNCGGSVWRMQLNSRAYYSACQRKKVQGNLMATIGERIVEKTFEVLESTPEGVRYSDLVRRVIELDGTFKQNTVHGNVWNLDERFPDRLVVGGLIKSLQIEKDWPKGDDHDQEPLIVQERIDRIRKIEPAGTVVTQGMSGEKREGQHHRIEELVKLRV